MAVDPVSLAVTVALNAASMALTASQTIEGPRLDSLDVTTASYGTPMSYFHGVRRFDGVSCIWAEPLREVKRRRKTKGGKYNEYTYYGTWAVAVADHQIDAVTRIWFDRNLVYDTTGAGPISPFSSLGNITDYMRIYLGTADQDVDPRMSATIDAEFGAGSTPAYRGVAYIVFQDLPLEKLGNRLPQVTVEAVTASEIAYPYEVFDVDVDWGPNRLWGFAYSPDRGRLVFNANGDQYEIWDVAARAQMVTGEFPASIASLQTSLGIDTAGNIYAISADNGSVLVFSPDGTELLRTVGLDYDGRSVQILQTTDGSEWICVLPQLFGYNAQIILAGTSIVQPTPLAWPPSQYFIDSYGDLWVVGGEEPHSTSVYFERLVYVSESGKPGSGAVTGLASVFGYIPLISAFHSSAHDQFVVRYDEGSSGSLMTIDDETFAIKTSRAQSYDVYNVAKQFTWIKPNASTFWLNSDGVGAYEIDSSDVSLIRTLDFDLWSTDSADGAIYDGLNNALITAPGSPAQQIAWRYIDRATGQGATLRAVVEDVSSRCGLESSDIDATDLDQTVTGYSWTQGPGKAILDPLLEAYDSEARPHNFIMEFLKRGASSVGTIPVSEMGAGGGDRYKVTRTLDTDLPLSSSLTFADIDGDQQPNTALSQRGAGTTDSSRQISLDLSTWASNATEARQKSDGYLRRQWLENESISNALTRAYTQLEPGDAWQLALDEVTRGAKLSRIEFGADGVLTCTWRRYGASTHTASPLPGAPADGFVPSEIIVFGYTKGIVLDIPLARDADDGLIVYLAAAPYSGDAAWPGATFYRGDDNIDFDEEVGGVLTSQQATIGTATSILADGLPEVWDRASTVTVRLFDGELTSATELEVLNGANLAILGDELIQFTTATLTATLTYELSGFLRGRRGSEAHTGGHASGDRFVLLSGVPAAALGASDLGVLDYYKPITTGGSGGFSQALTFSGASLKPYSPAHLMVEDQAGDLVATWVRRARIGGAWRDYQDASLGEGSEAYVLQVLDAGGSVLRTYSGLSTPTGTYTAADQATDAGAGATLRAMQVSATVGNGFPSDIAI